VGLSIARQLIELHGGQISAKSVVGRGSLFWVHPAGEERLASARPRSFDSPLQHGGKAHAWT